MHAISSDRRTAPLSPKDRALCAFAAKLSHDQEAMAREDLKTLRALGLADRAIHDAVQVVANFNHITRVADALGLEPEEFIQPWGRTLAG